jgi:hypothetical protein
MRFDGVGARICTFILKVVVGLIWPRWGSDSRFMMRIVICNAEKLGHTVEQLHYFWI